MSARGFTPPSRPATPLPRKTSGWMTIAHAAEFLDTDPAALRRRIERAACRAPDGVMEADIDGVRARKLGRSWRVHVSARWIGETGGSDRDILRPLARSIAKGGFHGD